MSAATVLRSDVDGVAILTLNRPEKLNALSPELFEELRVHVHDLAGQADRVGGVILNGAGRAFCAGADLDAMKAKRTTADPRFRGETILMLERLPQVVVASIHGYCYTGGLELALAADFLVAAESSAFRDNHAAWGRTPGWGLSVRLPRRVGMPVAKDIMFTGRPISAAEALDSGLVDRVFPDTELEAQTMDFLSGVLKNDWPALQRQKAILAANAELPLVEALDHEWNAKASDRTAQDAKLESGWKA